MKDTRESLKLAAVRYEAGGSQAMDALLTTLAHDLRHAGFNLAGAVQSNLPVAGRSRCDMILEDLASRAVMRVSEDRGPLAQGCRLDTAALDTFACYVLGSLGPRTHLAIINRFGKREAEGRGLRSVIEAAVLDGIPALVGVSAFHWPAWQAFAGNCAALIPADEAAILNWCEAQASLRKSEPRPPAAMKPVSRKVEVFLDVATTREEIIQALRREACPSCEITILDVADPKNNARAAHLGIDKLPAIVLNGKPLAYCKKPCPAGKAAREAATKMHPRKKK